MKKSIFTICCTLLSISLFAAAPDTITVSTEVQSRLVATDIIMPVNLADSTTAATLPSFAAATNHFWDLTHVAYGTPKASVRYAPLGQYAFYDSLGRSFDSLRFFAKGSTVYVVQGVTQNQQVLDTQTVILTKPSGNKDTIAFTFESYFYNGNYNLIPYPLTYTTPLTTWGSSYSYKTDFNISDASVGLKKSAAAIYTKVNETNTVVGWGRTSVTTRAYDSANHKLFISDSIHVLQVKTINNEYDSIVLPNHTLYDSLGFDSVYNRTVYTMNFYRQGALKPIVKVTYFDATFDSVTAIDVSFDGNYPVSVPSVAGKISNIKVYPNPVTNGTMYIDVPDAAAGQWSYQMVNLAGQQVAANALTLGNGTNRAQVSFGTNLVPGIYYVRLINNNQVAGVQAVVVQ